MIADGLAYVALVVADVEATATLLARDLGLRRRDGTAADGHPVPVLGVGTTALALFPPGDPMVEGESRTGVHHIALAAADLSNAMRDVVAAGIPLAAPEPSVGLDGARRLLLAPHATAGVRTWLSEPVPIAASPGRGMGSAAQAAEGVFIERLDHVGVASIDNTAAVEAFCRRLGCPLESTQTDLEVRIAVESFTSDKYGAVHHTRAPEPAGGLRVAFVTVGDCELEFLQDFDPHQGARVTPGRPGTTKQDQGAISRYVAARGPGLHHVAFKVTDIDEALARLERAGHTLIDRAGRPGSRRARIAFIHPKSLGGVLVHLVERDAPATDPSAGSPSATA